MEKLRDKIWKVKKELPVLQRDTEGYNFKYVNLAEIEKKLLPLMATQELGFIHDLRIELGYQVLVTTIFGLGLDEEKSSSIIVPTDVALKGQNAYQSIGSAITYYKRYNLTTLFDIVGTDEDVDSLNAKLGSVSTPTKIDYISKVRNLISLGRKRVNLERFYQEYEGKMTEEERAEIIELIKTVE